MNSSIEYSTDFDFFLKHQIYTSSNNSGYATANFNSRLESRWLGRLKRITSVNTPFSDQEIVAKCKEIHQEMMEGKFGTVTFID